MEVVYPSRPRPRVLYDGVKGCEERHWPAVGFTRDLSSPSPHKRKMQLNLKGGFERTFFLKGSAALCSPRKQGFLQSLKRSVGQGKDGEKCRRGLFISRYNRSEARVSSLSTLHIQISRFQRRCIHVSFLKLKKGRTAGLNP